MNLAEANHATQLETSQQSATAHSPSARWENFPYSRLSEHPSSCCKIAREWTQAMDFAQLSGGELSTGPRWLRAKYKWGPSSWPMHWCELVKRDTIDCGAHAALALMMFRARGLTAFPVQLVQKFDRDATTQWRGKWDGEGVSCHWLDDSHIYHEATALLVDESEVKLWDASAGSWIDSRNTEGGYGSVTSIRIFAEGQDPHSQAEWGGRKIALNVWNQLR